MRFPQQVTVGGQAPAGALTGARLVGIAADGSEQREEVGASALGAPDSADGDYLRVEGGQVTGRLRLRCVFSTQPSCLDQPAPRPRVRTVLLELDVDGQTGRSNAVRVDLDRPTVRDAWLAGTDAVVVRFTEPVRQPSPQTDAAGDWRVSDPDATVLPGRPHGGRLRRALRPGRARRPATRAAPGRCGWRARSARTTRRPSTTCSSTTACPVVASTRTSAAPT